MKDNIRHEIVDIEGASRESLGKLKALLVGVNEPIMVYTEAFDCGMRSTLRFYGNSWIGVDVSTPTITLEAFLKKYSKPTYSLGGIYMKSSDLKFLDVVTIKPVKQMIAEWGSNQLGEPLVYNSWHPSMEKYCGKQLTVKYADPRGFVIFQNETDKEFLKWLWGADMLQRVSSDNWYKEREGRYR